MGGKAKGSQLRSARNGKVDAATWLAFSGVVLGAFIGAASSLIATHIARVDKFEERREARIAQTLRFFIDMGEPESKRIARQLMLAHIPEIKQVPWAKLDERLAIFLELHPAKAEGAPLQFLAFRVYPEVCRKCHEVPLMPFSNLAKDSGAEFGPGDITPNFG